MPQEKSLRFLNSCNYPDRSRRQFLREAAAVAASALAVPALGLNAAEQETAKPGPRRLKVAAIYTEFTYRSHAHVILENFLEPYLFNGQLVTPPFDVVSFIADQTPEKDIGRQVAQEYGIPLFQTIDQALCLGKGELAVDAVLSIGEHGKYPVNKLGQTEYPRKRFFDEIVGVQLGGDEVEHVRIVLPFCPHLHGQPSRLLVFSEELM
jgi:hypothetical protein